MVDDEKREVSEEIEEALKKLHLDDVDWARALSPHEILYLLDRCPFLQIVSTNEIEAFSETKFITAQSGWTIHHYGEAMSSSPGPLLFQGGDYRILGDDDEGDDGEGGTIVNPGKGTIVKQAFTTAAEMIALAQKSGWRGVRIIDGHPLMQWAAWMQATDDAFHLEGYEPDEKARKKRERVKRSEVEDQLKINVKPTRR
ncbi:CBU_1754 family Dot/Icm T4SS effector [Coxiella burnetii]|uniref:Uncharacterized protein CBU_1754 n=2 Tax=Coxiella burnetii TaxID=777 RepID=Y1754_COXBU|nr:CBU_1754 family Dot/Icm T4SS effector [Coxiella burnetii]NP_820734.1 hypothetical protein CBU_1754 [Coxiella burnetii RSA 493]Q83AX3.1 RecName: Full=Uncharacterized protein CBU_1754 [Coxiella burnetii RSA 493]AAO91248.1 hypothetical protein CBU_1754 [Coxiella burnetii RSA 493]ABS78441.1 hypothetical protein CBUD_0247 [Coxiella burnetii Dugway 5J108-111]ABX77989.1 hypothetical protein COXBURSA331_A1947 [Coxiella burnetii RSA 331]ACJ17586.1 hypothetical protein CbuG_0136 [Coxiella burnetii C